MDDKTKFKMLTLAVLTTAKAFIPNPVAGAIIDILEEDVILNWDTIWEQSQKKKILIGMVKMMMQASGESSSYGPFQNFLACCDQLGVK